MSEKVPIEAILEELPDTALARLLQRLDESRDEEKSGERGDASPVTRMLQLLSDKDLADMSAALLGIQVSGAVRGQGRPLPPPGDSLFEPSVGGSLQERYPGAGAQPPDYADVPAPHQQQFSQYIHAKRAHVLHCEFCRGMIAAVSAYKYKKMQRCKWLYVVFVAVTGLYLVLCVPTLAVGVAGILSNEELGENAWIKYKSSSFLVYSSTIVAMGIGVIWALSCMCANPGKFSSKLVKRDLYKMCPLLKTIRQSYMPVTEYQVAVDEEDGVVQVAPPDGEEALYQQLTFPLETELSYVIISLDNTEEN